MKKIDIQQAKQEPDILFQLASQEEVIITQNEQPIFRLTSFTNKPKRRQSGSAKNLIIMSPDFDEPLDDFQEYMA